MMTLLEESWALAEEEKATSTLKSFVAFINDMLPLDIVQKLEDINGGSEYLSDIWQERYEVTEKNTKNTNEEDGEILEDGSCQICERFLRLTKHHVFPRETHKNLKKKDYDSRVLNTTIAICRMCHSTIHRLFTNEELSESFYTVDLLLGDERFFKYAKWAANLPSNRYKK
ncbi:hypothetical protein EON65_15325 [archaeon]|nr:MAG: hypothetical protein EON65_15325 [archaeon]